MPYSTSVTFLEAGGGATPTTDATARLWMLWTVSGSGTGSGHQQQDEGASAFALDNGGSRPSVFSFARDGTFASVSRGVGLSIQDTNRVANDTGWVFRSGRFEESLPMESIEVIAATETIPAKDLPGLLPGLPMQVDDTTVITGLSAAIGSATPNPPMRSGIDFTATGTTIVTVPTSPGPTPVDVGFRFTGRIVIEPSSDVAAAELEALSVGLDNPEMVFVSGPTVGSAVLAEVLNLLRVFILRDALPGIRAKIERRLHTAVLAKVGRKLKLPDDALPAGVTLSVRSVSVNADGIAVRGALGAFGGVLNKLPPIDAGGSGKCPQLALAALGYVLTDLALMRELRDNRLGASDVGRRLIALYYRSGREISALLTRDRGLAARAGQLTAEVTDALRHGGPVPQPLRRRCEALLQEIATVGSPEVRSAVSYALDADVWRLIATD